MNGHAHKPDNRFTTTQWSVVLASSGSTEQAQAAMEELCDAYWYPLYAFARRFGKTANEAEDLTQAFFAQVFEKQLFRTADPARGRFRSFLLTLFKRFIRDENAKQQALKRGGAIRLVPMDFGSAEQQYQMEPVDVRTPEALFERRWAITVLDRVLGALRDRYDSRGNQEFLQRAQACLTRDLPDGQTSEKLAEELGMSAGAFRVAVHRMREDYRDLLRIEISKTLSDPEEFEAELARLKAALSE